MILLPRYCRVVFIFGSHNDFSCVDIAIHRGSGAFISKQALFFYRLRDTFI